MIAKSLVGGSAALLQRLTVTGAGVLLALAVLLAGCGGGGSNTAESADSVREALHGHWATESGNSQCYFDGSSLIMISDGRRTDQAYTVLESHEEEGWIKIRIETEHGLGDEKKLEFSADRRSITEAVQVKVASQTVSATTKWNYVDPKTAP